LTYDRVVAVDPGAKTPIVTCDEAFNYQMLSNKRVKFELKEYVRRDKLRMWTGAVENEIQKELMDNTEQLSFKNENYLEMAKFKLKYFDVKQKCYERRNVIRLRFDAYIQKQKVIHNNNNNNNHQMVCMSFPCHFSVQMDSKKFNGFTIFTNFPKRKYY
jgi:hypothetical protein